MNKTILHVVCGFVNNNETINKCEKHIVDELLRVAIYVMHCVWIFDTCIIMYMLDHCKLFKLSIVLYKKIDSFFGL